MNLEDVSKHFDDASEARYEHTGSHCASSIAMMDAVDEAIEAQTDTQQQIEWLASQLAFYAHQVTGEMVSMQEWVEKAKEGE